MARGSSAPRMSVVADHRASRKARNRPGPFCGRYNVAEATGRASGPTRSTRRTVLSTTARQDGQPSESWLASNGRAPSPTSRPSSGAKSRTSRTKAPSRGRRWSWQGPFFGDGRAQFGHAGTDPGFCRTERNLLRHTDLLGGLAVEACLHQGPALLGRESSDHCAQPPAASQSTAASAGVVAWSGRSSRSAGSVGLRPFGGLA